jgi:pilus assembly protein CpaB
MNVRALLVAAVFAALGIISLFFYMRRLEAEASGGEKVSILAVAKPAPKGTLLTEELLSVREIPIGYVEDRMVRLVDKPKVLGVRIERDLDPQESLLWTDLSVGGYVDRHLSQLIQPGARALTLHIPSEHMSIQMLRPGDYVDLLGVVQDEGRAPQAVVLLQKVLVLAVGEDTMPSRDGHRDARFDQLLTISVTLQESQTISLATQKGPVIAVLRPANDTSVSARAPVVSQLALKDTVSKVAPVVRSNRPTEVKAAPGAQ